MQQLSSALTAALIDIDARVTPRVLIDLYEFYDSAYIPGPSGFDPDDAEEKFAAEEITWNGNAYRREIKAGGGRGDIVRNMGEKTNSVTITFSNISRYLATWAQTEPIEGKFLVIRTVVPSVTDDSIVLFVGRCDKPSDIDKQTFTLTARQDFGNINQELPPRTFTADDPTGRTPSDPLYEGFRITALNGSFSIPVTTASTSFFGRLFGKKKTEMQTRQWSSLDATPYGSAVPMIFGRCQMEFIPILFADIGYHLIGVWVLGEGRVDSFSNVIVRDDRYLVQTVENHFGDPGGTGTNATNVSGPINQGYLSKTAYTILSMYGSAGDVVDEAPTVTALARGVRVPVPNSSGVFDSEAWTDNPVAIARFILTDPRLVRINPGFMEDDINYLTHLHCDEPLIDDSNGELTLIPTADFAQLGTGIQRFRSTGIIDSAWVNYYSLETSLEQPELEQPPFDPFDPGDIPTTFAITRVLRKRYTVNVPITERVRAIDFLYKVIFPAAKLFLRINKRGKYEIRTERSADATMLRSASSVGDTSIPILDVTPWKTGPDLLTGRLLLGFGIITSEVRNVSSAVYSASGNSVTLDAVATGTITATESGANLSGGSTTVQASGTVTIGGTPDAGDTVTITIDGIESEYVLDGSESTGTVAAMLAAHINANPRLDRYISAVWEAGSPNVVTIRCKHGALTLNSPLLQAHSGPMADPIATPSLTDSAGALGAGIYQIAYSDVNALGQTALSPVAPITITANKKIDVGAIALVGTSRNWYMSDAAGSQHLKFVANTDGSAFSINALPLPGAAIPRDYNTTGEELIRVAMSFATNSQDIFPAWSPSAAVILTDIYLPTTPNGHKYQVTTAGTTGTTEPTWPTTAGGTVASGSAVFTEVGPTFLGQAGLTRANIKKDTFKWPLNRQSSVNQIKISYRDANNDFALTPYRVNDPTHQAQVNKIYPLEVDGSAIDNFHQMFRIANWQLAKNREGDWFNALETGPQGLVLEEGDPICASDDSGGLVNVVTRIEELRIHPNHDVSIAQARKYSTLMFADEVGADTIPIPTTLRYVQTVDSIIEFIDNYPIRDADGLSPGFYVAVSRDLADTGDWRGWTLWADYGDGYVQIADNDLPAVMGTATTTLGGVTDPSVWDRTNSITFTLKYGPLAPFPNPFATVAEQDILSNARRNLFLVGNEYLQAAVVVDNGSRSYTISTLLRGRFGTDGGDGLAHGSNERVVYLDGSENFVGIDVTRLNGVFNYKAVTVNQDLAGATAVPFSWTGGNLRPLSPVNLRGTRDTAGSLLIEWTRRSRLGVGMTPGSDVPLAEETEVYDVEILTTGNVLKRTIRAGSGVGQAAILLPVPGHRPECVDQNSLISSPPSPVTPFAYTHQEFTGSGSWVEATLYAPGDSFAIFGLTETSRKGLERAATSVFDADVFFTQNPSSTPGINVREGGSVVYSSGSLGAVSSVRIRIVMSGTELRYYWDYTGPGSVPFYVTRIAPTYPLVAFAQIVDPTGAARVDHMNLNTLLTPSTIYSVDQQTEDFGSAQNPIRVRVSQVSAVVGRGPYTQRDL